MGQNLYEVLGVGKDATDHEIKRAYRRLAHRFHPDKNPGDATAEDRFKEATRAYEILSNPQKRKRYDRFGTASFQGFGENPKTAAGGFGDVFSEIFTDFFSRKRSGARKRGRDSTLSLKIDFKTAVLGGERDIEAKRRERCTSCSGTGSQPGSAPQLCHACGGTGEIRVQQGLLSASKKCTYCRGRGKIITHPCKGCDGTGSIARPVSLKVRIPPGSDEETVLQYPAHGEPGTGGATAGDLRLVLKVDPHPIFRREGQDLHCELPVTFVEASLGAQVHVPTIDGRVLMTIPRGTQSGRVFRLRGKGVPNRDGSTRGDQHVTVMVETPTMLDNQQRRLIETLDQLDDEKHYPERAAFWNMVDNDE